MKELEGNQSMKTRIYFWSNYNPKYLYGETCFEQYLINSDECFVKKLGSEKSVYLFLSHAYIDVDIAKNCNRFDTISARSFKYYHKDLETIIHYHTGNLSFIVINKCWDKEAITLDIMAFHMDFSREFLKDIQTGEAL